MYVDKVFISFLATPEPGEDPRVTRAKYFIRDEFLVSRLSLLISLTAFILRIEINLILHLGIKLSSTSISFHGLPFEF